jgi:hypothetical protein
MTSQSKNTDVDKIMRVSHPDAMDDTGLVEMRQGSNVVDQRETVWVGWLS